MELTSPHKPQPSLVKQCNEYCSRIVYIDLNGRENRSNIRRRLTTEMQRLDWYPREHAAKTTFLFYKRFDSADRKPEDDVEEAIKETQRTYPEADFQFAVLRPVTCSTNIKDDDSIPDLFRNMFKED